MWVPERTSRVACCPCPQFPTSTPHGSSLAWGPQLLGEWASGPQGAGLEGHPWVLLQFSAESSLGPPCVASGTFLCLG